MGLTSSKMEKALQDVPEEERFFGLENFSNTCYANSVIQLLYWCEPFRRALLAYYAEVKDTMEENLLMCLAELFEQISTSKKRTGVIAPRKLVSRVRQENAMFSNNDHQDAHEFLNYVLNEVCDAVDKHKASKRGQDRGLPNGCHANGVDGEDENAPSTSGQGGTQAGKGGVPSLSWVRRIFQGRLVTETQCLRCETTTSREEDFLDLSLEITQNCSLSACLRQFSDTELLNMRDKFFCDQCCSLQEAQKRMVIKRPPNVLLLHLKRFKYTEHLGRIKKLPYRVAFPMQLRLSHVVGSEAGADALYDLTGVVVHVGSGPYHGHYVALAKSHGQWLNFDDEGVEPVPESAVLATFGSSTEMMATMDHCFLLMYIRKPEDWGC